MLTITLPGKQEAFFYSYFSGAAIEAQRDLSSQAERGSGLSVGTPALLLGLSPVTVHSVFQSLRATITLGLKKPSVSLLFRNRTRALPGRGEGVCSQSDRARGSEAGDGPGQGVRVAVLRKQERQQPARRPGHVARGGHPEDPVQKLPRCA